MIKLDRPKGKVLPKCSGPYQFERYLGKRGLTAEISTTNGSKLQLSSTHLCLMLSQLSPQMLRWPERKKKLGLPPSHASEDPTLSTSLDDDGKEPRAVEGPGEEPHAVQEPGVEPQAVRVPGSKRPLPSESSDGGDMSCNRQAGL